MPSEIRPIDIADIGQLEAALEEVAAGAPPQLLVEAFVRHSYVDVLNVQHTTRNLFGVASASCSAAWLVLLSGIDLTDSSGECRLSLLDLMCGISRQGQRLVPVRNAQFVATAITKEPALITADLQVVPEPVPAPVYIDRSNNVVDNPRRSDVVVRSWGLDGTKRARTRSARYALWRWPGRPSSGESRTGPTSG